MILKYQCSGKCINAKNCGVLKNSSDTCCPLTKHVNTVSLDNLTDNIVNRLIDSIEKNSNITDIKNDGSETYLLFNGSNNRVCSDINFFGYENVTYCTLTFSESKMINDDFRKTVLIFLNDLLIRLTSKTVKIKNSIIC